MPCVVTWRLLWNSITLNIFNVETTEISERLQWIYTTEAFSHELLYSKIWNLFISLKSQHFLFEEANFVYKRFYTHSSVILFAIIHLGLTVRNSQQYEIN